MSLWFKHQDPKQQDSESTIASGPEITPKDCRQRLGLVLAWLIAICALISLAVVMVLVSYHVLTGVSFIEDVKRMIPEATAPSSSACVGDDDILDSPEDDLTIIEIPHTENVPEVPVDPPPAINLPEGDFLDMVQGKGRYSNLPFVPAEVLDECDNATQVEYLKWRGESPTPSTLARFGIAEAYTEEGEVVLADPKASGSYSRILYVNEDKQLIYVYYDANVYLVSPDGVVYGKYSKPKLPLSMVDIAVKTDSGQGYVVETQHYGFERIKGSQSRVLIHILHEESGEIIANDFSVFFDSGDRITIYYPQVDGYLMSEYSYYGGSGERAIFYYQPDDPAYVELVKKAREIEKEAAQREQ